MPTRAKTSKKTEESPDIEATMPEKVVRTVSCAPKSALNIRESADISSKVIGEVANGHEIECEEAKDGWCKVANGYVMAEFLA